MWGAHSAPQGRGPAADPRTAPIGRRGERELRIATRNSILNLREKNRLLGPARKKTPRRGHGPGTDPPATYGSSLAWRLKAPTLRGTVPERSTESTAAVALHHRLCAQARGAARELGRPPPTVCSPARSSSLDAHSATTARVVRLTDRRRPARLGSCSSRTRGRCWRPASRSATWRQGGPSRAWAGAPAACRWRCCRRSRSWPSTSWRSTRSSRRPPRPSSASGPGAAARPRRPSCGGCGRRRATRRPPATPRPPRVGCGSATRPPTWPGRRRARRRPSSSTPSTATTRSRRSWRRRRSSPTASRRCARAGRWCGTRSSTLRPPRPWRSTAPASSPWRPCRRGASAR